MAQSQNGYTVISRDDCKFYDIAGVVDLPLRPDACGFVLATFARRFHKKVERLGSTETFGHSERRISGSSEWSNHASGTALDLNASQHPYGSDNTFTSDELREIRELQDDFDDVIKWGGDYRYTKDEMHFEIDRPYSEVKALARRLRRDQVIVLSRLVPGKRNLDVLMLKRALSRKGLFNGQLTNFFGAGTRKAYSAWQQQLGYTGSDADGLPGRTSLEALGFEVKE